MTFERLLVVDLVAMVAALALLFAMGVDWYSTAVGDEARRIERLTTPRGALGGEVPRAVEERARATAEDAEKNAFQVPGAIDRVILGGLLVTAVLALAAAFLRAAARRFDPPASPSALAAATASVTALLVAYRLVQEPGNDASATVKPGAPLGLLVLGVIALACAAAARAEAEGRAWREPAEPAKAGGADAAAGEGSGEASIESTR